MEKERESTTNLKNPKKSSLWKRGLYFFRRIPGSKKDHFFLTIVLIDLFFFMLEDSYGAFLSSDALFVFLIFDFLVIIIWGIDLFRRFRKHEDKVDFLLTYWYEVLGILPFNIFRPFLLLRAVKIWLAYAKLFGKEKDIGKLNTKELTYKFRDMILDTISDAVFLKSLDRVEEVMVRLDYASLSKSIIEKYESQLLNEFNESMKTKEVAGAMARMPILEKFSKQISEDYAKVFKEMLESEVMGEIIKEFTKAIMERMASQVKNLDVERLVGSSDSILESEDQKI
jgi:hypothetical protein